MAKIVRKIQLSTNTIVDSKQAAQREIANVMAKHHYTEMIQEIALAQNPSIVTLVIDKYKDRMLKYIALMYEAEEVNTLNI